MGEMNWRQECAEWKEKWERLMQFKDAPRLPVRVLSDSTNIQQLVGMTERIGNEYKDTHKRNKLLNQR